MSKKKSETQKTPQGHEIPVPTKEEFETIRTSAALLFVAVATGCAFTPQTVVIEPTVEVTRGNIGGGIDISVYVVDERTTTELGRRGSGASSWTRPFLRRA